MPSQEENKGTRNENYDIDAVTELSEEEIERLLAEGAGAGLEDSTVKEPIRDDVLEMLEDADDDDLWDIQDMLKKSDRNEAIDAGEDSALQPEESPADKLLADIEGAGETETPVDPKVRKALEKQQKAEEKKRLKEEKASRRKAAKEAAKAQKAAKRQLKSRDAAEPEEPEEEKQEGIQEYDLLLDKDLLDSIVSDAGNLGREEKESSPKEGGFSLNELGSDYDAARDREYISKSEGTKVENVEPAREEAVEDGIMEVDMDEVDALIPDIGNAVGEEPGKNKKNGLMTKIISMLMEEEEEPENEDISISEENQGIIRDLDNEDKGKKGKKAKKPAKKQGKKKEKKKKPPKPAKPPKAKKVKEAEPYTGKKITFRKALPILLLGATVGAVVFIFVSLVTDFSVKQEASDAYRKGDYAACYESLYGKTLNDEQQKMLGKSESILYMEQMYNKYEIILQRGTEAEALDSLLQIVNDYPQVSEYAAQWEALPEIGEVYSRILAVLDEKYHLTEEQAREIAEIKSNIEYTRVVTAVAEGKEYDSWDAPVSQQVPAEPDAGQEGIPEDVPEGQPEEGTEALPDELPEESELGNGSFVDSQ